MGRGAGQKAMVIGQRGQEHLNGVVKVGIKTENDSIKWF